MAYGSSRVVLPITAYQLARRFIGTDEVAGALDNPQIMAMLKLDASWPEHDETPWCSAFVNYVAWLLDLPRSKSLRARSWLRVGRPVEEPSVGFDVAILTRGSGPQPGSDVINAPGHVGFVAGQGRDGKILLLGGNQGNTVNVRGYSKMRLLGLRRLI